MEKQTTDWIRPTAVAGTFYPQNAESLTKLLQEYCTPKETSSPPAIRARAIVVPHAGYIYSGAIAGEAYQRVEIPKRIVLLCPNHSGQGKRISVWAKGAWETPLGRVPVDEALAETFLHLVGEQGDREGHLYEHANEVHIPFLKFLRPDVSILPITLGPLHLPDCLRIGGALAELVRHSEDPPLLVASTDMSHYISADDAKKSDRPALDAISAVNSSLLYQKVVSEEISMCGFIPTTAVLKAASLLGSAHGDLIRYGNSGERTGDYSRVVAYAAAVIA